MYTVVNLTIGDSDDDCSMYTVVILLTTCIPLLT